MTGADEKPREVSETTSVRYIDGRRGRGLIAEVDFEADSTILCVPYDIAVLYSPFVRNTCYRCFVSVPKDSRTSQGRGSLQRKRPQQRRPTSQSQRLPLRRSYPQHGRQTSNERNREREEHHYECTDCKHLVLCENCVRELAEGVPRVPVGDEPSKPVTSPTWQEQLEVMQQHPLLQAHKQACAWFCSLPESDREGDTDYLRFALQYGSRALLGDTALLLSVGELCTNATQQPPAARQFCTSFARRVADTFAPQGFRVDADHLRDVLFRTKCNSIGYPFNETETLGWMMQEKLCMINHSCDPNAAIVRPRRTEASTSSRSAACSVELLARRRIKAGEEITIAYIDVDRYEDTQIRRRHLLESYWFLCMCSRCEVSANPTAPTPSPPAVPHKGNPTKTKNKKRRNGRQW
ncbi:hypothetical protein, conserved [Trypanosoma brucei gambiense DAL972]|uniref:SET domain-containing protein n=2 Tax=Trypanosoma brucei TaxID=5691 RepID=C9ZPC4_TRYB9|nr:hypothetical protein, conserved [Trypanosoma brucei gambiense DAL972]RHW72394.1 SET domain containing protein [Trypanosoma brucei equiperdum]CBH11252.1 hypothetical protein, conserved [Trypanosoma brucei gambiense DAL972]|eukprot:XP_011773539.1 hypothetical protein, conserved [Trypanosoma brucei gambiense DAL972]